MSTVPAFKRPQNDSPLILLRRREGSFSRSRHSAPLFITVAIISIVIMGAIAIGMRARRSQHPSAAAPVRLNIPLAKPTLPMATTGTSVVLPNVPAAQSKVENSSVSVPSAGPMPVQDSKPAIKPTRLETEVIPPQTIKASHSAKAPVAQSQDTLTLVMPEPVTQSQPSRADAHLAPPSVTSASAHNPTGVVRSSAPDVRKSAVPTALANQSIVPAQIAGKVNTVSINTSPAARTGNRVAVAPTSIPALASPAKTGTYGKVASAGIPGVVKGIENSKMIVAPVSDQIQVVVKPSEGEAAGCGNINEAPCPKLKTRPSSNN